MKSYSDWQNVSIRLFINKCLFTMQKNLLITDKSFRNGGIRFWRSVRGQVQWSLAEKSTWGLSYGTFVKSIPGLIPSKAIFFLFKRENLQSTIHPVGVGLSPRHNINAFIIYSQFGCFIWLCIVKRTKMYKKVQGSQELAKIQKSW